MSCTDLRQVTVDFETVYLTAGTRRDSTDVSSLVALPHGRASDTLSLIKKMMHGVGVPIGEIRGDDFSPGGAELLGRNS